MRPTLILDTFVPLLAIGLLISVGTLVSVLLLDALDTRRSNIPSARARFRRSDIKASVARAALSCLILVLTLTTSGLSSSISNLITGEQDCCASGPAQDEDSDHPPCPPMCHSCPCSPVYAVPEVTTAPSVARVSGWVTLELVLQRPVSPPGPTVFHPPRTI